MSEKKDTPLGQLLIDSEKITEEQLQQALSKQKETGDRLGHTLIKLKIITEDDLIDVLEKQFGIPAVKINKKMLNPILIKKTIPESICRKYRLIPVLIENNKLTIAASNPYDLSFKEEIKFTTGLNIDIILSPENSILDAINYTFGHKDQDWKIEKLTDGDIIKGVSAAKTLQTILDQATDMNAKEIQLELFENKFNVLFITPQKIVQSKPLPINYYKAISLRIKQLANLNLSKRQFQDGLLKIQIKKREKVIRILIFPNNSGENIILKLN